MTRIEVSNIQYHYDVPFEDYLKMDGFSFSGLKSNGKAFTPTAKMKLGSDVDTYINEPAKFTGDLALVKPIAREIIKEVGLDMYRKFEKQVSITADFIYDGMVLNYKGRPDWFIKDQILIDTKVSDRIEKTLYYFNYPDQLMGYNLPLQCPNWLILAVSPITKQVSKHKPNLFDYWWKKMIQSYGKPL